MCATHDKEFEIYPCFYVDVTVIQFLLLKMLYHIWPYIFFVIFFTPICYLASLYLDFISLGNNLELLCLTTNLTFSDGHLCYILLLTHSKPLIWSNTFNVLHRLGSWLIPSLELLFPLRHYGHRGEEMGNPLIFKICFYQQGNGCFYSIFPQIIILR